MRGQAVTGLTEGLRQAVAFLTPLGGARAPSSDALRWFPVIGLGLGLALGGIWWGAGRLWPAPVAAALVVAADLGLTGLLHVDGLTDSADGLLPPLDRERRLEVMAAPDVGAACADATENDPDPAISALAVSARAPTPTHRSRSRFSRRRCRVGCRRR